jgi:hypothetical protein
VKVGANLVGATCLNSMTLCTAGLEETGTLASVTYANIRKSARRELLTPATYRQLEAWKILCKVAEEVKDKDAWREACSDEGW